MTRGAWSLCGLASMVGLAAPHTLAQCEPAWVQRATSGPPARQHAAMAYDAVRQRVVLFGGRGAGGVTLADTWVWDGSAWMQRAVPGPSARILAAMAYDSVRQRLVLFGGFAVSASASDTWEWDGAAWELRATSGPPPRYESPMVFDSVRARTVLLTWPPGVPASLTVWEWDGAVWSIRPTSNAGPDYLGRAIYDSARDRVMPPPNVQPWWELAGDTWIQHGYPALSPPNSQGSWTFDASRGRGVALAQLYWTPPTGSTLGAWEWDPNAERWVMRNSSGPGRTFFTAAYDAARARLVVFGGLDHPNGNVLLGDTWEYNPGPGTGPAFTVQPFRAWVPPGGSVVLTSAATGAGAVAYRWSRDGVALEDGGSYSGTMTSQLTINPLTTVLNGSYSVTATDTCGSLVSREVWISAMCYANCDGSTTMPVLTVQDFGCFLGAFASWCSTPYECYANCDGSTAWPYLNVTDFLCYLNRFAAGCS